MAAPRHHRGARRSPFVRTSQGVFWTAGVILSWLTGGPDVAGILRLRLDTIGLLYLASAIVGGNELLRRWGGRAARTLRPDMNLLMSVAIVHLH